MMEMGADAEEEEEEEEEGDRWADTTDDASQAVMMHLSFVLQGGSLTLLTNSEQPTRSSGGGSKGLRQREVSRPLTKIRYENLKVELTARPASMTFEMQLESIAGGGREGVGEGKRASERDEV
jgi:hypothetical protein